MRREFPRDVNGLVDLDSYLPYLPDTPDGVPLELPFNNHGEWLHQHVYFEWRRYKQKGIPAENKDWNLVNFRHSPFNQIIMRRNEELKVHKDFEEDIDPPEPEIVRKCLEEYQHIINAGAAAVGLQIALGAEASKELIIPSGRMRARFIKPSKRIKIFRGTLEDSIASLRDSEVAPYRVVSGALKRIALLIGSEELHSEADARLQTDPIYFPVKIPNAFELTSLSNRIALRSVEHVGAVAIGSKYDWSEHKVA